MYTIQSSLIIIFTYLLVLSTTCNGLSDKNINETVNLYENGTRILNHISEDAYLNITQLARKYGYNIEEYKVTTEDGYILTLHRLSSKKTAKNNIAVFLMHGISDSSDTWMLSGPNSALAYELADKGYDVWMGNARGNKYSMTHTKLDSKSSEFWKFSWHEIGIYDLPVMIDYVLKTTGNKGIYYAGHSQGTTVLYVLLALKPEYNAKVHMMFALAPITSIKHAKSPVVKIFTSAYGIFKHLTPNSIDAYATNVLNLTTIPKFICSFLPTGCNDAWNLLLGHDYKFVNADLLPVIYSHFPTSASVLQFVHYVQTYISGRFCPFDYGPSENLIKYGSVTPPEYDLTKVTVPVVLFYSANDWLSDIIDVKSLFAKLPNVYGSYKIARFNHFDYLYAYIAKDLVYSHLIKNIEETFKSKMQYAT